nr:mitochondrial arginine transporter bac2 [Quercus suber]
MDFWLEFVASSWGRSTGYPLLAGGFGGMAGIISGYPLDTLRIRQQQSISGSAFSFHCNVVGKEGPAALYRGMGAPLASVTFHNAVAFQIYAALSRAFDSSISSAAPASFKSVALAGFGTGALQSLILSPIELVKIRLQLQSNSYIKLYQANPHTGPVSVAKSIFKAEGLKGMYRGLSITFLRDAERAAKKASTQLWSVREEGYRVLWRGLGNAVARAFLVSGGYILFL